MESAPQQCSRLVAAFDDLVAVESTLVVERGYEQLAALQERIGAVVTQLTALAPEASDEVRHRVHAIVARRTQEQALWSEHISALERDLQTCREARSRLTNFAPAYRSATSSPSRLQAHG